MATPAHAKCGTLRAARSGTERGDEIGACHVRLHPGSFQYLGERTPLDHRCDSVGAAATESSMRIIAMTARSSGPLSRSDLVSALECAAKAHGCESFVETTGSRPDVVILDPQRGLIAIDIHCASPGPENLDPIKHLNQKVAILRDDLPQVSQLPTTRFVVHGDWLGSGEVAALAGSAVATSDEWLVEIPTNDVDPLAFADLRAALGPSFEFNTLARVVPVDPDSQQRASERIRLDREQQAAAMRTISGLMILTGCAGSGKTMVLAARARWLAEQHPDWRIQLLCYNRMLVPYLRGLVEGHHNIEVSTFGKFSHSHGHSMSLSDEDSAAADLRRAVTRGIDRSLDALLIDEWQDFFPSWTAFCLQTLRPNRGGALLATDERQALYRDATDLKDGAAIQHVALMRPYRSTRQILEVTAALDPAFAVENREQALDGEVVELIWAEEPNEQARAIAFDIKALIDAGARRPRDFGVLVTVKRSIGSVVRALADVSVPCQVVKSWQPDEFDRDLDAVTISTVHSAKGYEFPVVCLVGLDQLPEPDGTAETARRGGRVGYVGTTRAQDQLMLTYSKDNVYLERLRTLGHVRQWVWPDDYGLGD